MEIPTNNIITADGTYMLRTDPGVCYSLAFASTAFPSIALSWLSEVGQAIAFPGSPQVASGVVRFMAPSKQIKLVVTGLSVAVEVLLNKSTLPANTAAAGAPVLVTSDITLESGKVYHNVSGDNVYANEVSPVIGQGYEVFVVSGTPNIAGGPGVVPGYVLLPGQHLKRVWNGTGYKDTLLRGQNLGDQTSIVGITGTIEQFNAACTDADFATAAYAEAITGRPNRLYNLTAKIENDILASKPTVVSTLTIGDSIARNCDDYIRGRIGTLGQVVGIFSCATEGTPTLSGTNSEYAKTPFGNWKQLDSSGDALIFGKNYATGVPSSSRLDVARFFSVHYEAVSGGGSFKFQYESDVDGVWTDITTINTNNSGASTYTIYESSALTPKTARIRCLWVSGTSTIYTAGASLYAANAPAGGDGRCGAVTCDVSSGGSTASQWALTTSATWTTFLAWAKTDVVIVRELMDGTYADYQTGITNLVATLRAVKPTLDFIFVGTHATNSDSNNLLQDAWTKAFCETNGFLFVDCHANMPATWAAGVTAGLYNGSNHPHLTTAGSNFVSGLIWQHMAPLHDFVHRRSDSTRKLGPVFNKDGIQGPKFYISFDGNIEDSIVGVMDHSSGTDSPNPPFCTKYLKNLPWTVTAGGMAEMRFQQYTRFVDLYGRNFYSSMWSTGLLTRALTSTVELWSSQADIKALILSAITGQTANIEEVRTGVSLSSAGTLKAGYSPLAVPFATLTSYANDAAADADTALPSGGYYQISGARTIYRKP